MPSDLFKIPKDLELKAVGLDEQREGERSGCIAGVMGRDGARTLMDLGVVKRVCRGDACICFGRTTLSARRPRTRTPGDCCSAASAWQKLTRFSA